MIDWKYVMFDQHGLANVPIIFPASLDHDAVVQAFHEIYPGWTPVSAGHIDGLQVEAAFGISRTTKLAARPQDVRILNRGNR